MSVLSPMSEQLVSKDNSSAKVAVSQLRAELTTKLGIRCSYPTYPVGELGSTARCILEEPSTGRSAVEEAPVKAGAVDKNGRRRVEDIFVKLYALDELTDRDSFLEDLYGTNFNKLLTEQRAYTTDTKIMVNHRQPVFAKHSGIGPLLGVAETERGLVLVQEYQRYSLLTLSRFYANTSFQTPSIARGGGLNVRDLRLRFVAYQLLNCVNFVHSIGLFCGDNFLPSSVQLDDTGWVTLCLPSFKTISRDVVDISVDRNCYDGNRSFSGLLSGPAPPPGYRLPLVTKWLRGIISNFEYLMAINHAAGRSMNCSMYHPVMPWVTDFTTAEPNEFNGGLRDLSMSKFRLSKGDRQLETTYLHSVPPHHLPESLSELTYFIYMARVTPLHILRRVVRSEFVPEHYPQSMTRLYSWSPDECIPEFYSDINVFKSIHTAAPVLLDIELPEFAKTPEKFIKYHREILESDYVSEHLHFWIDLNFGCSLIGEAAVKNKNVPLQHTLSAKDNIGSPPNMEKHPGFCILFDRPHPIKHCYNKQKGLSNSDVRYELQENPGSNITTDSHFRDITGSSIEAWKLLMMKSTLHMSMDEKTKLVSSQNTIAYTQGNFKSLYQSDAVDSSISSLRFSKQINLGAFDPEFSSLVDGFENFASDQSFAEDADRILRPKYRDTTQVCFSDSSQKFDSLDKEFVREVLAMEEKFSSLASQLTEEELSRIRAQASDAFTVGCFIAEMYIARPVLGIFDNHESFSSLLSHIYSVSQDLPLPLRRSISLLLHPNPFIRPRIDEMLLFSMDLDLDLLRTRELGHVLTGPHIETLSCRSSTTKLDLLFCSRKDILQNYCSFLFPSYFNEVYAFISSIKLCSNGKMRLKTFHKSLLKLKGLTLDGFTFILPHILMALEDTTPFFETPGNIDESFVEVVLSYNLLFDFAASRLSVSDSENILIPKILNLFRDLSYPAPIQEFLVSDLWRIIILRAGVKCFLRNFLPLLMTYLVSSNFQDVVIESFGLSTGDDVIPVWAGNTYISSWMSKVSKDDLRQVQKAAYLAITNLNSADSLGPGICTRYILPAILCLVGVPQLLVSACSKKSAKYDSPPISPNESSTTDEVAIIYDPQEMFVVRTIIDLSQYIGIDACAEIILKKIFDNVLPNLAKSISQSLSISSSGSFMEVFFLLNGLLASLSQEFVKSYYLRPHDSTKISLCTLLSLFPQFKNLEDEILTPEKNDENARRQLVQTELYRLLITTCMYVGPEITIDAVLPHIDEFFKSFVNTYGVISLDRKDFHKALEMAADLFVPIIQLVEAEAFYTAVPHLNPRLEMWLLSKSAGEPCTSPPLPASILPAAPSSGEAPSTPKTGKGFMNWLSGLGSKSMSKSTATKEYERNKKKHFPTVVEEQIDIPMATMKPKLAAEHYNTKLGDSKITPTQDPIADEEFVERPQILPDESECIREELSKLAWTPEPTVGGKGIDISIDVPNADESDMISEALISSGPSAFYSNVMFSGVNGTKTTKARRRSQPGGESKDELTRNARNLDSVWLLAGCDRWTSDDTTGDVPSSKSRKQKAAAQLSMTSPSVSVDVASAAGAQFNLKMQNLYTWEGSESGSPIRTMTVNHSESLLLSSSKTGINVWGLSCHPLRHLSTYARHSFPAFRIGWMRCGSQVASCDGNLNIWDLETCTTIGYMTPMKGKGPFIHMDVLSPRAGVTPGLLSYGDNQILACSFNDIYHFDFRVTANRPLRCVAEWTLPPLSAFSVQAEDSILAPRQHHSLSSQFSERAASAFGQFTTSYSSSLNSPGGVTAGSTSGQISYSASVDYYTIVGSDHGILWILDRRNGKTFTACQAHDNSIVNIFPLSNHKFISVSEKSSCVWNYESGTMKKLFEINGSAENITTSTSLIGLFDQQENNSQSQSFVSGSYYNKSDCHLYCFSGHKMYTSPIPVTARSRERSSESYFLKSEKFSRESDAVSDFGELKLTSHYVFDEANNKIKQPKMIISSAVLLPLRKLLLLGTEDGLIRSVV